ncbi:copper resistance CopC family protein [Cellulomonas hominis]|uniref:copper resistance CopC family protein n=1 Tax=Cellulomonas hominis TaxID=156981 RepID=UPI001BCC705F|nr:copper resistance CopC family protein [Cellulomonas hominis]
MTHTTDITPAGAPPAERSAGDPGDDGRVMSPERRSAPAAPSRPVRARAVARPAPAVAPRVAALLLAVLLGLAAVLATATRADAHNALQGTDPADGSTVATPPTHVTLTFDQPAQALGTEIVVVGPDGSTVSTGTPELVDTTVSQALAAGLPAGDYTVQWRVTSADGHPLSGELGFTASAGSAAPVQAAPEPSTTSQASPQGKTFATLAPESEELAEDEGAGLEAGVLVAIVVAVLAAGAVTVFVVRERRRARDGRAED